MSNPLGRWGVSPRAEELYRFLLRSPEVQSKGQIHARNGWDDIDVLLSELVDAQLLRFGDEEHFVVAPPFAALERMVTKENDRLRAEAAAVERARDALLLYSAEYRPHHAEVPIAEFVSYDKWTDYAYALIAASEDVISTTYVGIKSDWALRLEALQRAWTMDKDFQLLVAMEFINDEEIMAGLKTLKKPGSEIRFVAKPATTLGIYGSEAAVHIVDPEIYTSDRLVIRTPALIAIFRQYFQTLWSLGISMDSEQASDRDSVLLLLAQGLKDEAIASQLGLSLRTVRRRISELMDRLGAESRFEAGVEAVRRGLI